MTSPSSPRAEVGEHDTNLQRGASKAVDAVNLSSGSQENPHLRRVALRRGRCQLVLQRHRPNLRPRQVVYSGGDVWIEEQIRLKTRESQTKLKINKKKNEKKKNARNRVIAIDLLWPGPEFVPDRDRPGRMKAAAGVLPSRCVSGLVWRFEWVVLQWRLTAHARQRSPSPRSLSGILKSRQRWRVLSFSVYIKRNAVKF